MATPAKKVPAKSAPAKSAPPVRPAAKAPSRAAAPPVEPEVEAGEMTVTATLSKAKAEQLGVDPAPSVSVQYNFGANLDDAVERFGADVVFGMFVDSGVIGLQAKLRRAIMASIVPNKAGQTVELPDDHQELVGDWKPTLSGTTRKSPGERLRTLLAKLSPAERQALLANYQNADEDDDE